MRTVVFVERQELEYSGNLAPNALALGDVDNDEAFELAVGNTEGDLLVFKGEKTAPVAKATNLGMISCVGIGDICNKKGNRLFTFSAEGFCHIFVVDKGQHSTEESKEEPGDEHVKETHSEVTFNLTSCHYQQLPANAKIVLLADIDGDKSLELVIGYTDRKVRVYRWHDDEDSEKDSGKLILLQKWILPGQIGSLSLSRHPDGSPKLVVSQPGCNYAELICSWAPESLTSSLDEKGNQLFLKWHPITNKRARNANISTEIVANVSKVEASQSESSLLGPDRFAMCTLDGTLMLIEEDRILWSLLVDHQLFAIQKLDIMCDGHDEVVACALDGQTYIVDHNQQSVRFHFEENVCAFAAGLYSTDGRKNAPCLVYATYNNKIFVYWNVRLPRMSSLNLLDVLATNETFQEKMRQMGIDASDPAKVREVVHHYMYKLPPKKPRTHQEPDEGRPEPKDLTNQTGHFSAS